MLRPPTAGLIPELVAELPRVSRLAAADVRHTAFAARAQLRSTARALAWLAFNQATSGWVPVAAAAHSIASTWSGTPARRPPGRPMRRPRFANASSRFVPRLRGSSSTLLPDLGCCVYATTTLGWWAWTSAV